MTSSLTLLATLGVSAAGTVAVCGLVAALSPPAEKRGRPSVYLASRAAARLCLGLSSLFALAAAGELWLNRREPGTAFDLLGPSPWGALWVYPIVLLAECRLAGLRGAGRRTFAGLLLAGAGVLYLGIGLTAWTNMDSPAPAAPLDWTSVSDMNALAVGPVAALGLVLVPLASIAVGVARPAEPPLSTAVASVAFAAWLQPALPALGWLPVSPAAGAALAALLVAALVPLAFAASRGPWAMTATVLATFSVSIGGCTILGVL